MIRVSLIVGAVLAANLAHARMPAEPIVPAGGASSSHSAAVADATQLQGQLQGQAQGQQQFSSSTATGGDALGIGLGGDGGQGGDGGNASSSQDVSISYRDRLQAPAVMAPAVYASGPCAYGWSVGVTIPGAGVSGGKAKTDPACDRRELARVLTPLQPALALKLLCADPMLAEVALPEDCVFFAPPVVTSTAAPAPDYATREELRRAFEAASGKAVK